MPIDYRLDPATRIVHTRLEGSVSAEAFTAHAARMDADPEVAGAAGEFVDLSRVDFSGFAAASMRGLASALAGNPVSDRLAVWAPGDLEYGIGRMYAGSVDASAVTVRVFRDREAALAWLEGEDDGAS